MMCLGYTTARFLACVLDIVGFFSSFSTTQSIDVLEKKKKTAN